MNVLNIANELAEALSTVLPFGGEPGDALRVYVGAPQSISDPCAVVVLPETISFSNTYNRGMDSMVWPVLVLSSKADARTALERISAYADGSGESSIKAALEGYSDYTAFDTIFVSSCALDLVTWNGVDYQGALFELQISGSGS